MASEDFVRAAAAFRSSPIAKNVDGVRKYISILESSVRTDASTLTSVASKMRSVASRSADVLRILGGKSPVAWQLVRMLLEICSRNEDARLKASENDYLLGVLAHSLDSPDWPTAEVPELADLAALLSFGARVQNVDYGFAIDLVNAACDRIETAAYDISEETKEEDSRRHEDIACSAGLILVSLLRANPCLARRISAADVERGLGRMKSPLSLVILATLKPCLAPDTCEASEPAIDLWVSLETALRTRQWKETVAAAARASMLASEVPEDVCQLLDMDWTRLPGICVKSALDAFEKVCTKSPPSENVWKTAVKALSMVGYESVGFRLGARCYAALPSTMTETGLTTCYEAMRRVFATRDRDSGGEILVDDILEAMNFLETACSSRECRIDAAKFINGARCYLSPENGGFTVRRLALEGATSDAAASAVTRVLGVLCRRFIEKDKSWSESIDRLLTKDEVIGSVRRTLISPRDSAIFWDAWLVLERMQRSNESAGMYSKWRALADEDQRRTSPPEASISPWAGSGGISRCSLQSSSSRNSTISNDSGLAPLEAVRTEKTCSSDVVELITAYEQKIKRMAAQKSALQSSVRRLQAEIDEFRREWNDDQDESVTYRKLLLDARQKLKTTERRLVEACISFEEAQEEERRKVKEEKEELAKEFELRAEHIQILEARLATTISERDAEELARKSLAEELDRAQAEKADLSGKLKKLDEKNKELAGCVARAEKKIASQEKKIKELTKDLAEMSAKCDVYTKVTKKLEKENETMEKFLEEKNAEITELQQFKDAILNVAKRN